MKTLSKISTLLILFSQINLAVFAKSNMVFCVQDNGKIAVEPSINGICEDSKTLTSQKSKNIFFQIDQIPPQEGCQDFSICQATFFPETNRKSNNLIFLNPVLAQSSTKTSCYIFSSKIIGPDEYSVEKKAPNPHFRRTVVLLI